MKKISKNIFMFKKFLTDIRKTRQIYELVQDMHSNQLSEYYFIFQEERVSAGRDQALIKKFDDTGIPINKTYIDVTEKEYVYFPISIGQMGLSVFHTWLNTQLDRDKDRFLKFVDWFYKNGVSDSSLGVRWLTNVPLPQYKNPGPWQSAFAQSRGISILLRGYQLTRNKSYADMAERALIPFTIPVSKGGVTSFTEWGPFYEEYTAEVPTLVLNGMIFSLCGIYDFYRVFPKNKLSSTLFHEGVSTLEKILPEFDLGFWSRYNLCQAKWYPDVDLATLGYQRLHIIQLEMLYQLTKKEIFKTYEKKFLAQDCFKNIIKMYLTKYWTLKKLNRL